MNTRQMRLYKPNAWRILHLTPPDQVPHFRIFALFPRRQFRLSSGADDTQKLHASENGNLIWAQSSGSTYHLNLSQELSIEEAQLNDAFNFFVDDLAENNIIVRHVNMSELWPRKVH